MKLSGLETRRMPQPARVLAVSIVTCACLAVLVACATAQQKGRSVRLEFTSAEVVSRWQPTHDVSTIESAPEGMRVRISGGDPYIIGPPVDPPSGTPLWIRMRLLSEAGGTVQVFFFRTSPTEERSARASVPAKRWTEVSLPVPQLEAGTRLRIDPPGTAGTCTISWLELAPRSVPALPRWAPPPIPRTTGVSTLSSGSVAVLYDRRRINAFTLQVQGYRFATGWSRLPVAYESGDKVRWFDAASVGKTTVTASSKGIRVACDALDPDGARWRFVQTLRPTPRPGGIAVTATVAVSSPRNVYFLPVLAIFPGRGSFGTARERGLLAGVEYLDPPDQSSSQADLRGEQAQRLVPDQIKLTFPLMVMQARKRYLALMWNAEPWLAAAFDTPDRSFGSKSNAMALLVPGSDGTNRSEGSLLPYTPLALTANRTLTATATIFGGAGESVLPAVQRFVQERGLPELPRTGMDKRAYARWAAGGWLDSRIREGARFRHAYWPGFSGFSPQPAADAALWMEWLASVLHGDPVAERLQQQVSAVLDITDPATRNSATVSHVTYPAQALLFGDVRGSVAHARSAAQAALKRFEPDGTILYRPSGGTDYGQTHFEKHANGLTAPVVVQVLQNALYAGDRDLVRAGLEKLRALDRYVNSAPRGAQTWEVPLHTPDILASAHLVKAYVLGYEITGDKRFLRMARHWAWTGVPFVYLHKPTEQPVGLYATTPVLGATNWVAPNWIGLPVQWCGLVYSDALYRLARYDEPNLWRKLAQGITISGIQQSWPASDKDLQGLLPDSFVFRSQNRNPVAINPGTVQANAVQLYGGPLVYDYRHFPKAGLTVHAPAALEACVESASAVQFTVRGWTDRPYWILIHGCRKHPLIQVNGKVLGEGESMQYEPGDGRLILRVSGTCRVSIQQ